MLLTEKSFITCHTMVLVSPYSTTILLANSIFVEEGSHIFIGEKKVRWKIVPRNNILLCDHCILGFYKLKKAEKFD